MTLHDKLKEIVKNRYIVENFVDYVESEFCCYLRFISHSTIYMAEMRKFGSSVNYYKLEGSDKL